MLLLQFRQRVVGSARGRDPARDNDIRRLLLLAYLVLPLVMRIKAKTELLLHCKTTATTCSITPLRTSDSYAVNATASAAQKMSTVASILFAKLAEHVKTKH